MNKRSGVRRVMGMLALALAPLVTHAAPQRPTLAPAPPVRISDPARVAESLPQPGNLASMDADERRQLRANYAAWQALPAADRQQLVQAAARFASLPPAQQQELRTRFAGLDQMHRRGWRLGPVLGMYYPRLQGLFGFVAPAQQDALLAMLRQFDGPQLERLSALSQRTPPQERDALLARLLALDHAGRVRLLQPDGG